MGEQQFHHAWPCLLHVIGRNHYHMLFHNSTRPHTPRDLPKDLLSLIIVTLTIREIEINRCEKTGFIDPATIPYVLVRKSSLLETKTKGGDVLYDIM